MYGLFDWLQLDQIKPAVSLQCIIYQQWWQWKDYENYKAFVVRKLHVLCWYSWKKFMRKWQCNNKHFTTPIVLKNSLYT